jgi:pimeloyl-ACP methyl ester carboxylesterase
MTQILRSLAEPLPSSSSTVKALRRDPNYLQISAESIDQIGCGEGPALPEFADASRGVEWLASYIRDMKRETPDLPVVVLTRSSSAAMAVETAKKHPELVDALVLMSPSHPGDPAVFDGGLKVVMEELRLGLFEANMPNLLWIAEILKQLRWDASTFNRPTYIMTGGKDLEVSALEREHYSLYATTNPNVAYRDFSEAGHNILDTNKKETKDTALAAYADVLAFVNKVVNLHATKGRSIGH